MQRKSPPPAHEPQETSPPVVTARKPAVSDNTAPLAELEALEQSGRISRQGLGAQRAAERLAALIKSDAALSDAPLWDACCGRGGKTCALLERGVPVVLASDPSASRVEALRASLIRLGLPEPETQCGTVQDIAQDRAGDRLFPLILLDAPCSGTGTLARAPELRARLSRQRIAELVALQEELLVSAWGVLAPGGLLAYMTCALTRAENESQVEAFLAKTPEARLECMELPKALESSQEPKKAPGQDFLFLAALRKVW